MSHEYETSSNFQFSQVYFSVTIKGVYFHYLFFFESLPYQFLTCDIGWRETQGRDPVRADTERKADILVSI